MNQRIDYQIKELKNLMTAVLTLLRRVQFLVEATSEELEKLSQEKEKDNEGSG